MREDGYSKTVPTILTSIDVLESGEFNKMKIYREYDLLNRSINYMNRCGTHKQSSYCLVITIMKVENSIPYTKLKIAKCRMDHGKE